MFEASILGVLYINQKDELPIYVSRNKVKPIFGCPWLSTAEYLY